MSLIGFDSGTCRRCHKNGKCEVQKELTKAMGSVANKINSEFEDDSIVANIIISCNRAGE